MTLSSDEDPEGTAPLISRTRESPKDRYNQIYVAFFLCGVATLLPWNFFITAIGYFKYKLRNVTIPQNETTDTGHQSHYQQVFESYLVITSSVANAIFMVLNTLISNKLSRTTRYTLGSIILFIAFIVVISFTQINTDKIQPVFFYVTLALGVLCSAGSAFTQGSVVGMAGIFPDRFPKAVMEGMAIGGITAAVASILSLYVGSDPVNSGLLYFIVGFFFIILAFALFLLIPIANFSKFYIQNAERSSNFLPHENSDAVNSDTEWAVTTTRSSEDPLCVESTRFLGSKPSVLQVMWMVKLQSACLFITFIITLSIFPSVLAAIVPVSNAKNAWTRTYFIPVSVFLLFNVGDYLGRATTSVVGVLGRRLPSLHVFLVFLRLGFVPLALMCNVQPRHHGFLPVLLNMDFWPALLSFLLGISNGYLATSCLVLGVTQVDMRCMETAGNSLTMFMVLGIACGCGVSFGLVNLV